LGDQFGCKDSNVLCNWDGLMPYFYVWMFAIPLVDAVPIQDHPTANEFSWESKDMVGIVLKYLDATTLGPQVDHINTTRIPQAYILRLRPW
jgi:hypothetical protein